MPKEKNLPSKLDQEYSKFLRGIKLIGLGLEHCNTRLDRDAYYELYEKKRSARKISADYQLVEAQKEFFNVLAKFRLSVEDKRDSSSTTLLIECAYAAHFHCAAHGITQELAQRFTESELRLVVWPYFRQFVNDLTARMAITPILIPFSAASRE